MESPKSKICVICGKSFIPTVYNRSVCYEDHYHPCPVCGRLVLCNEPNRQNCTCSRKCGSIVADKSRQQNNIQKYGVAFAAQIPSARQKLSDTQKKLHPKQPLKMKICEVCGKEFVLNYPYTAHTCSSQCRGKYRKQTGISQHVYEKATQTNFERYGVDNQGKRPEVHKKMEDTMEARYGVRYARYIPEVEAKVRQTCMERYGVPYYIQLEEPDQGRIFRISKLNQDFAQFCKDKANIDLEFEFRLDFKYYDLYLNKLLIEIDPTYTHNAVGNHWSPTGLAKTYHFDKTQIALDNGYRCIHVFDWDDWSKILQLIKPPTAQIYARNCIVQPIDKTTANMFTSEYHISGSCQGQVENYGLFYNDELVEVMTFGRPRYNRKYEFELLRLCTKHSYQVVGGASKLFSAFKRQHTHTSVISYCDRAKFTGAVYQNLGMRLVKITEPNKIWSNGSQYITQNLLNQRGYDQLFHTSFGKGTSNDQLMLDNGWLPVYDCGQFVFKFEV